MSLIHKSIINGTCCESAKPEDVDSECESDDTTQTQMRDSLSRTSVMTATSLPTHPIHVHYVHH